MRVQLPSFYGVKFRSGKIIRVNQMALDRLISAYPPEQVCQEMFWWLVPPTAGQRIWFYFKSIVAIAVLWAKTRMKWKGELI